VISPIANRLVAGPISGAKTGPVQSDDEKLRDENDAGATLTASPG